MATKFREPNKARWVGTRPGHNGVQIYGYLSENTVAVHILLAAHATKTTFITHYWIKALDNVTGTGILSIYDATPAIVWQMFVARTTAAYPGINVANNYWPPLEIPPTYTIRLELFNAIQMYCGCLGWQE